MKPWLLTTSLWPLLSTLSCSLWREQGSTWGTRATWEKRYCTLCLHDIVCVWKRPFEWRMLYKPACECNSCWVLCRAHTTGTGGRSSYWGGKNYTEAILWSITHVRSRLAPVATVSNCTSMLPTLYDNVNEKRKNWVEVLREGFLMDESNVWKKFLLSLGIFFRVLGWLHQSKTALLHILCKTSLYQN